MEAKLCQSCGMPLSSAEVLGTNADGSLNEDSRMNFTKEEAIAGMKEFFPTLKRWQSKQ